MFRVFLGKETARRTQNRTSLHPKPRNMQPGINSHGNKTQQTQCGPQQSSDFCPPPNPASKLARHTVLPQEPSPLRKKSSLRAREVSECRQEQERKGGREGREEMQQTWCKRGGGIECSSTQDASNTQFSHSILNADGHFSLVE